jgi:hypothetical protein
MRFNGRWTADQLPFKLVSRLLRSFGHELIVANPTQVKLITESSRKDDRLDAQTLARLARIDPQLLRPIQHRSEKAQTALMVIRVRALGGHLKTGHTWSLQNRPTKEQNSGQDLLYLASLNSANVF